MPRRRRRLPPARILGSVLPQSAEIVDITLRVMHPHTVTTTSSMLSREQFSICHDGVPRANDVLDEDAGLIEWVGLQKCLGFFLGRRLVDDEGAGPIDKRPGRRDLPLFLEARQVLPMHWAEFVHLRLILQIFDDGCEFHGGPYAFVAGTGDGAVAAARCTSFP